MLLRILLGLIVGFLWEMGAVRWTRAVMKHLRLEGTFITLLMGLANLSTITVLAWGKHLDMPIAFVIGESLGTYICIGKKEKDV